MSKGRASGVIQARARESKVCKARVRHCLTETGKGKQGKGK